MTEKEQIDEIGKVMPEKTKDPLDNSRYIIFGKSLRREIARIYYKAGYRKFPKDSVVLSREEYEKLKRVEAEKDRLYEIKLDLENQLIEKGWTEYEGADEIEKRISKETAEKILDLLVPDCKARDENWHNGCLCLRATLAEKIAKQFGLEIKE